PRTSATPTNRTTSPWSSSGGRADRASAEPEDDRVRFLAVRSSVLRDFFESLEARRPQDHSNQERALASRRGLGAGCAEPEVVVSVDTVGGGEQEIGMGEEALARDHKPNAVSLAEGCRLVLVLQQVETR